MRKIKPEDLDAIKEQVKGTLILREGVGRAKITVHMGTCGIAAGARSVMSAFMKEIEENNANDVIITTSSCAGLCSHEPMATIEIRDEPPVKYIDLNSEKAKKIFSEHIMSGKILKEYALAFGSERAG